MSISRTPALTRVSIVGPGRLGLVLARALRAAGVEVHGPVGRGEPVPPAEVVLLCVPDAAIPAVAARARPSARLLGHTSGAAPLDAVDFGWHPLQTFTGGEPAEAFHGIACAIDAHDDDGLAVARTLAVTLGAQPFVLPAHARAAYHAAASFASNFLVTIEDAAERMAGVAGIRPREARAMLAPLVRRTVENWVAHGAAALTGPIARGDEETVARQRTAVTELPELLPLFDALSIRTRAIAATRSPGSREENA
ncbi:MULTISPECIES: DUF2520 domain-containing protein [Microbacterium]|uniref:DUF2520 domain-containing protein n=1 Tax=Microbacterium TaxID=33882 RepID=UPI00217F09BD|nr:MULTISPECIES: DUF2520 domain-containing protein [Microbacterium]UWF77533.1 DUF2520 domain-containing protein [Microbacterium neungamense]WCM55702.1 DUF2520 domain-containing protein [Microbacterium sp. EF45047]